ncbi:MAG: hypothetical protein GXP63_05730 [DPANN group archaeon]|nr:hypothetical protein [DPANN group archaeon]
MRITMLAFIVLVLFTIVLAACSTTQYVCEDGRTVTDQEQCSPAAGQKADAIPTEKTTKEPIEPSQENACMGLTDSDAYDIARERCDGNPIEGRIVCNENTRTIWIDLDLQKEGCSPACVINADNKSAEINWRCTGLVPVVPPIEKNIEADIQQRFEEAGKSVKSYSYQYYGPGPRDDDVKILVKGDRTKLIYRVPITHKSFQFDTVYLTAENSAGVAYCENIDKGACINPNHEFSVASADFTYKLPSEWIDETIVAEETSSEFIGNRNALKLAVTTDLGKGIMWIDDFYGMPVKVRINSTEWEYRDIVFNAVSDEEMTHQHITPRPEEQ